MTSVSETTCKLMTGREGVIVGFYRTEPERALVFLPSGDREQVPVTELRLVE